MFESSGPTRPRTTRAKPAGEGATTASSKAPRAKKKKADAPSPAPLTRTEQLRYRLVETVAMLKRRRADLIPPELIEDFVDLDWLVWQGGTLTLTQTGANVCQQVQPTINNRHT